MITRLILENFMAHGRTELELGPGLCVLTGPNNTGKSAVVEALRCVATNLPSGDLIRHGAKLARITVELDSGESIIWERKKAYAIYKILRPGQEEPQVYAKCGNRAPEDVAALLRLDMVDVGPKSIDVHLGNQRQPVFLLDESGSVVASFFAVSTEAAHLLHMQHALKTRVTARTREEKALTVRTQDLTARLDAMSGLPDAGLALERAEELAAALEAQGRDIPALETALTRMRGLRLGLTALTSRIDRLAGLRSAPPFDDLTGLRRILDDLAGHAAQAMVARDRLGILADAVPPPVPEPCPDLARTLGDLLALRQAGRRSRARATALERLREFPTVALVRELGELIQGLRASRRAVRVAKAWTSALDGLSAAPPLQSVTDLCELAGTVASARARRDRLAAVSVRLADLSAPPQSEDLSVLKTLAGELAGMRTRTAQARRHLERCEAELVAGRERIGAFLERTGSCPLCGSPMSLDHFLSGEAAPEAGPVSGPDMDRGGTHGA